MCERMAVTWAFVAWRDAVQLAVHRKQGVVVVVVVLGVVGVVVVGVVVAGVCLFVRIGLLIEAMLDFLSSSSIPS